MKIILAAATSNYELIVSVIGRELKPGYTIMRSNSMVSASISNLLTEAFPDFSQEDMVPSLTGGYNEEKLPAVYKNLMSSVFGPIVVLTCEDKARAILRLFQKDGFILEENEEWMKKYFYIAVVDTEKETVNFVEYKNKRVAV